MPHNHTHTQPVQLQHRNSAASTRITLLAFIPHGYAEVNHVTLRRHLYIFPSRPHWCDVQRWDSETFLWPQTSSISYSNQEQWQKRPQLKGPTLGWLCFLWWKYLRWMITHLPEAVWVAPFELSNEIQWKTSHGSNIEQPWCTVENVGNCGTTAFCFSHVINFQCPNTRVNAYPSMHLVKDHRLYK